MLVLTRKPQETILIGNDIVVTVIRTKGKAVRLGISAPNTVPVLRGEINLDEARHPVEDNDDQAPIEVLHTRVPRNRVAQVLPQLSMGVGAGPLAAMVQNR